MLGVISTGEKRICVTRADSMNIYSVQIHALGRIRPRAAEQVNGMTAGDDAAEDLPEVKLGTAGLWILAILPVEDKYPH
jgi:hypothetical protein